MDGEFENFKEQVRASADIVDIVSGYVSLTKKGNRYWGCCPFHGEKTPSFAVTPQNNLFYCFGCHEGGDLFKFVQKIENCNFFEALKIVAGKYGIPVPEKQKTPAEIQREQRNKLIYNANDLASKFYHACLTKTKYGVNALNYLHGRGITDEIIASFTIGYALNNYDSLRNSLGKRGVSSKILLEAGLELEGRNNSTYDKFRNRVMIPIKDARGKIVGFGGRVLDDSLPKYLNTGETEWFNKRRILFGLDVALDAIRKADQIIIVEGYMDAISLHAAGIGNAVASMGTAFAAEQAKLIARMASDVVFCYDSDAAGRRASVRAVSVARQAGLKVRIAGVPDGKDPDEFVRAHGKEAFLNVIAQAKNGIDFQIDETIKQNNITTLAGKVDAVSNIIPFLLECKNEIEVAEHIKRVALLLTIDEGLIRDEYRKAAHTKTDKADINTQVIPERKVKNASSAAEEMLVAELLHKPDYINIYKDEIIKAGINEPVSRIFAKLIELYNIDRLSLADLTESLDDEAASLLAGIMTRPVIDGDGEIVIRDCIKQLTRTRLEKEYDEHRLLVEKYEREGDDRFVSELREIQRIKDEIKKLY
ncbi:MAG: DNA primase [Phascolarctobacterium sp.]|nr:DNA primase [Phascolarctobacterium sp.]